MFSYHELNLYLNEIELPKALCEISEEPHGFEGHDLQFLTGAKKYLSENLDFDTYKSKSIYCIGTCMFNLTQIGLYLLLEDGIIFVSTSTLRFDEGNPKWVLVFFSYKDIVSLEFNDGDYEYSKYDSGVLFIKLRNEKKFVRNKTIRNINPNHIEYLREFHEKMMQDRYI